MNLDQLVTSIKGIEKLFGENELAYLSLTMKNEGVIRDKLAYKLYMDLSNSIAMREYKNIDLTVWEDSKIQDIIELKSMYTFDIKGNFSNFTNSVKEDFLKREHLVKDDINQYAIIIATHLHSVPNDKYKEFIKYYHSIKKHINDIDNKDLIDDMDKSIRDEFNSTDYTVRDCFINGGKAFDTDVEVYFWIIRKDEF